jgi:DNA-binding LacI/PurR family transcriptional regulator
MKNVNLKKIAEKAHVSAALVSQILNHKGKRIPEETRRRILRIAEEEHYVPNRLASALKNQKTYIIAIVVPFTPVGFFVELIYYLEEYAMSKGYQALVINTFNNEEKEEQALFLFHSGLFDGMIVAAGNASPQVAGMYRNMQDAGFPFVFVDRFTEEITAPVVSSDHYAVAFNMTTRMLDAGKRNIFFLGRGGQMLNSTVRQRREGYGAAMRGRGLEPWEAQFFLTGGEEEPDTTISMVLAGLDRQPEAIFLHSGYYMPHLLKAYRELPVGRQKAEFMTVDKFSFSQDFIIHRDLVDRVVGHFMIAIQDIKRISQSAIDTLLEQVEHPSEKQPSGALYIPARIIWG